MIKTLVPDVKKYAQKFDTPIEVNPRAALTNYMPLTKFAARSKMKASSLCGGLVRVCIFGTACAARVWPDHLAEEGHN